MRKLTILLCLVVAAAACGDGGASTTTTTSTTTPTATTTTTTLAPIATVADLCVIGVDPGATAAVHSGAGDEFDLLGELPHDATGVSTTGVTMSAGADEEWTEIVFDGGAAWVRSEFLTSGQCDVGDSALWAVLDIACDSELNVRNGHGAGYDIVGTLEPDAFDLVGTGVTALDDEDRTWVQIAFEDGTAWVAGWFLTADPGPTIDCSIPEFPWIIEADTFGPLEHGDAAAALEELTGLEWTLQDTNNDCTWYVYEDKIGVQAQSGTIVEMWAMSSEVAITPEGFQVGQSKSDAGTAYFGRAVLLPGPFVGTNIVIDGASYAANWTYLFIEDPFDNALIGTIRINDDGGYIEGGCS